jgi:hypothetical protein
MKKPIPKFKNESEEFAFWSSAGPGADSTKYVDWPQAKRTKFPNLRPTLRTISLRLPVALKVFLAERLAAERKLRKAG